MTEKISPDSFTFFDNAYRKITGEIAGTLQKSGRKDGVLLLGATKTQPPELINHAISRGLSAIGENRVQEYLSKYDSLNFERVERHFIGNLQTNKVKYIVDKVDMIESVGSLRLLNTIAQESVLIGKTMDILLEVNIGGEQAKGGFPPGQISEMAEIADKTKGIRLCGLMTIPPFNHDKIKKYSYFEKMQKLFVDICGKKKDNRTIMHLSMGMSDDYVPAIMCGATIVRVGTALFGCR